MQTRLIWAIVGLVIVLGVGFSVYDTKKDKVETDTNEVVTPLEQLERDESATTTSSGSSITLSQVATHNSRSSCWSAINGNVYDLTSWIPNHPGGEQAILSLCGIDGSSTFNGKHGSNPKQAAILIGFKIGALAK